LIATLQLLMRLLAQPAAAMSDILDRGSLLFASIAALAVSLLDAPFLHIPFYLPVIVLAAVYVPCILALGRLFGQTGDYGSLLTCAAMAWTASQIEFVAAIVLIPWLGSWVLAIPIAYFAVLMFLAVRIIFGMGNGGSAATVVVAFVPLLALPWIWGVVGFLLRYLASPFFLFYAWYFLGGELGNLGAGLRNRQHFHKMLEAAAINPHDGDAQYQLGLIYQQRRRYSEAIQRFEQAVKIDPTETDAHYQLGKIAREQGRMADAFAHFQTVARQNPKHNAYEILRELGAVAASTGNFADAKRYLAEYVENREYDPEGLYWYGQALEGSGEQEQARQMYARAVEAARTAPRYRRRLVSRWSRLARKRL
jgi:tetratricopeptide (TPR) repeat protein